MVWRNTHAVYDRSEKKGKQKPNQKAVLIQVYKYVWHADRSINSREFDVTPRCQDRSTGHNRQAEEHKRGGHLLVPEKVARNDDQVCQALKHSHLQKNCRKRFQELAWSDSSSSRNRGHLQQKGRIVSVRDISDEAHQTLTHKSPAENNRNVSQEPYKAIRFVKLLLI